MNKVVQNLNKVPKIELQSPIPSRIPVFQEQLQKQQQYNQQTQQNNEAVVVQGSQISKKILAQLKEQIKTNTKQYNIRSPKLAMIMVGSCPATTSYVTQKQKTCKRIGINPLIYNFDDQTNPEKVLSFIQLLNKNKNIDSISLELPIPQNFPKMDLIHSINNYKDVDCLNDITSFINMNSTFQSSYKHPCTPSAIMKCLDYHKVQLAGKKVAIVGKGMLVGYPISTMMLQRGSEVTTLDKFNSMQEVEDNIKQADVVVAAAGVRHLIKGDWIKQGAAVIDVGANKPIPGVDKTKIVGDVEYEKALARASLITPVPGGVGPVTAALYMKNVVSTWERNFVSQANEEQQSQQQSQ